MSLRSACLFGPLLLALSGCTPSDWDVEVCSGADLELIDRAIEEAYVIEPYMDEMLSRRFDSSYPSYGEIIETLIAYRSREDIYCGSPGPSVGYASGENHGATIALNTDHFAWIEALEDWEYGRQYGALDAAGVERLVAEGAYSSITWQARAYLTAPAFPLRVLSHEATHGTISDCCHHSRKTTMAERGGCDFVDQVGWLAPYGLLWERWNPEKLWLDELYLAAH